MPDHKLGTRHRAALFMLMAEAREVSNTELRERWNLAIVNPYRKVLNDLKLVTSQRDAGNKPLRHELTDAGWRWCLDELSAPVPARSGSLGGALYAVLSGLNRYLDRQGLHLGDVFQPDAETSIRRAYLKLADQPRDWIRLVDLRPLLGDLPRTVVDDALRRMDRTEGVTLIPEAKQRILTAEDRAAAVRIGDEDNHLISIGES